MDLAWMTEKIKIWEPDNQDEDDATECEVTWINPVNRVYHVERACQKWCEKHGHAYLVDGASGWTLRVRNADGTTQDFAIEVELEPVFHATSKS